MVGNTRLSPRRSVDVRNMATHRRRPMRTLLALAAVEGAATFFYQLLALGSLMGAGVLTFQYSYKELSAGRLLAIGVGNGMGYGAVLGVCRGVSRAYGRTREGGYVLKFPVGHTNPVVTLAVWIVGDISAALASALVLAQCVGALAATYVIRTVVPGAAGTDLGVTVPSLGASASQVVGTEMIATFVLVSALLHVFVSNAKRTATRANETVATNVGPMILEDAAPLVIGTVMCALTLATAQISGASMNPVRSLSSAIVSGVWTDQWIYAVSPTSAAIAAAAASKIFLVFKQA